MSGYADDSDIMALEREIDSLRHEVHTYQEAFKAADFRATDYSQRIMAAVAVMDELGVHGDIRVHLNAALKLGDT
jgi:chromosome condensin MukBEF ATPase and DNA-binding subunit MukB